MTTVPFETEVSALGSRARPRPLGDWLTTFPMAPVVLDPYTEESARILHIAHRILVTYKGAGCRACWVLACHADGARRFLGPWAEELLTFADPERRFISALRLNRLPAFLLLRQDGVIVASAQGWDPSQWRAVAKAISDITEWNRPVIGDRADPAPYAGTPALP